MSNSPRSRVVWVVLASCAVVAWVVWVAFAAQEPNEGARIDPSAAIAETSHDDGRASSLDDASSVVREPVKLEAVSPEPRSAPSAVASDGLAVTGRVVGALGEPEPGASLWLVRADPSQRVQLREPTARTHDDGRFAIALAPGTLEGFGAALLLAGSTSPSGGFVAADLGLLHPGTRAFDDLALVPGGSIAGRLVTADGAPVAGRTVAVDDCALRLDRPPLSGALASVPADFVVACAGEFARGSTSTASWDDGAFVLGGLLPGTYDLRLGALAEQPEALRAIDLAPAERRDLGAIVLPDEQALAGVVVDADGRPVSQASVGALLLRPFDGRLADVTGRDVGLWAFADDAGRFRFAPVVPGEWQVGAQAAGFVWTRADVASPSEDLVLVLRPGGSVQLVVRDAPSGASIPDAILDASLPDVEGRRLLAPNGALVLRDDPTLAVSGVYVVDGVDAFGARVRVRAPGHSPALVDVPPLAEGDVLSLTVDLAPVLRLTGRVEDDLGHALEQAVVQCAPDDTATFGGTQAARTDAEGAFALEVPRTTLRVWVAGPGPELLSTPTASYDATAAVDEVVLLARLTRSASLSGLVVDAQGTPVAGVPVHWFPRAAAVAQVDDPARRADITLASSDRGRPGSARSDPDGRFAARGLLPGACLVLATDAPADALPDLLESTQASRDGEAAALPRGVERVELRAGEDASVRVSLLRAPSVTGRVRVAGRAHVEGSVALVPRGVRTRAARGAVLVDGEFRFDDVAPGDAWLVASVEGVPSVRGRALHVEVDRDQDVVLTIVGESLHGRVVERASGRPVEGVRVWIDPISTDDAVADPLAVPSDVLSRIGPAESFRRPEITSGADGGFVLAGLSGGRLRLRANGGAWLSAGSVSTDVPAALGSEPIDVPVERGATVRGRVSLPGQIAWPKGADVEVDLLSVDRGGVAAARRIDGPEYAFEGLLAGTYVVKLRDMRNGGYDVAESEVFTVVRGAEVFVDVTWDDG
ncbi:MAG: carboxypeptidase regulatory-like domain-containing protein [Planctomycetes bacterium]|nr:carboxypeptidase regulatory-like domain-containing protein [Planctomycetota bacterium]